jgi:acyl-CoA synthetase (AMP-forming)/AMP-acid ligase II
MRLHDYLDFQARETRDTLFAVFGGHRVSYGDAATEVNRIAHALVGSDLHVGDRIAILAKNCIEYVLLYYGASKAGVVPVPLNYRLAPPEWTYIIQDAGAKLLIAKGEYVRAIDAIRDQLPTVRHCVAIGATVPGWEDFASWLMQGANAPFDRHVSEDDDLYQMYTSGTTGRPKGAVLTHRAVSGNLSQLAPVMALGVGEPLLLVMPIYHAGAAVTCFNCVAWGGTMVIHEDFQPAAVVRALSEEGIAVATLVPAMIQACLVTVPDVAERRYDRLRLIVYGASPIAEQTLRRALDVFRCDFAQAYGMTEATAVLTYLLPPDHQRALREHPKLLLSAGRAILGTELRVVDDQDNPVPPGVVGEIIGRGPQLMRGYWNLPDASHEALRGGWLHTGDAGMLDEHGYIFIQDRVKDMIVSGGENIYPREIEDVLFQHPAVADAAVIGIPDDKWGESVLGVVVLRPLAQATENEIIDFCRGKLGGYKRPRRIEFVPELPRNPSGKVLKRQLREPYWAGRNRRVAGS